MNQDRSNATGFDKQRGTFVGEVIANDRICDEHYLIRLAMPDFPPTRAGQFVQLQCRPLSEQVSLREVDWTEHRLPVFTQSELTDREPLLRRPLSLAGRCDADGSTVLDIIYRAIGTGTTWLSGIGPPQRLSVLGPLGNAFGIFEDKPLAVMVAGGVGIPPMLYLAEALTAAGKTAFAFAGVRSAHLLPLTPLGRAELSSAPHPTHCIAEFADRGVAAVAATDDGSLGFRGMVSDAFRQWLDARAEDPAALVVYCCGPEPMMRTVAEVCIARGVECQLAMERHMACGMGTCQSCIVKVRDESEGPPAAAQRGGDTDGRPEGGWSFKLCCTDGPIFDARDILW